MSVLCDNIKYDYSKQYKCLLDCIMHYLQDEFDMTYIKHSIISYISQNIKYSKVRRHIFEDQTLESIKNDVMFNTIINEHLVLQAISTHLEIGIHFAYCDGLKYEQRIYPEKEPEVTYKCSRHIYVLKHQTNINIFYYPVTLKLKE